MGANTLGRWVTRLVVITWCRITQLRVDKAPNDKLLAILDGKLIRIGQQQFHWWLNCISMAFTWRQIHQGRSDLSLRATVRSCVAQNHALTSLPPRSFWSIATAFFISRLCYVFEGILIEWKSDLSSWHTVSDLRKPSSAGVAVTKAWPAACNEE